MRMNYFVVGTNNMDSSIIFYDALFEHADIRRVSPTDRMTYWLGCDFAFATAIPFDQKAATNGNGTMVGFTV
ncbi:MAG: VOC family protein, partial [Planctomycetota bacterium]